MIFAIDFKKQFVVQDVYAERKLVLHSRERRRLNQTACTLSKAGVPFASAAGTSFWAFACGVFACL
jgi:hypothetical protein